MKGNNSPLTPRSFALIIGLLILEMTVFLAWRPVMPTQTMDTPSYIQASEVLLSGHLDFMRPPIYPLIIGVSRLIFGTGGLAWTYAVAAVQFIAFCISIYYFGRLAGMMIPRRSIALWVTVFYALWPGITQCIPELMAESLSVSGLTVYVWMLARAWQTRSGRMLGWSFVMLAAMIMLKPIFIYLLGVAGLVLIIFCLTGLRRQALTWGLGGMVLVTGVSVGYSMVIKENYGYLTLSCVPYNNNYHLVRRAHVYPGADFRKPEMVDSVKKWTAEGTSPYAFPLDQEYNKLRAMDFPALIDFVNESMELNKFAVAKQMALRFYRSCLSGAGYFPLATIPDEIMGNLIRVVDLHVVGLAMLVLIIIYIRRKHTLPALDTMVWLIYFCGLTLAVVGAQNNWDRLTVPFLGPAAIFVGQMLSTVTKRKDFTSVMG